jgi:hypothetical protein
VYGLFWMIGLLASVRAHPHVVGDAGLRIRNSFTVDIPVSWDAIAKIRKRGRDLPGKTVQLDRTGSGTVLAVGVLKQTNVDVVLHEPTRIPLRKDGDEVITELRFYVDDPDALIAEAREHLTTQEGTSSPR